ncbi:hypothetical protein [Methyloligella halotolerans]|nr:hypothetical protein [Methyloligella halotolerans]
MSAVPISEPEASKAADPGEDWSIQEILNAGWQEADLDWERTTVLALDALGRDDIAGAKDEFGKALRLARENFEPIDPRLGTSLANYGVALALAGDGNDLQPLVQNALQTWRASPPWIAKLTAPRSARSSMFHLRMEALHRETYRARWRQRWQEIAEEAIARLQAVTDTLGSGDSPDLDAPAGTMLATWRRERPAMLNDTRKLLAARLLLLV